MENPRLFIQETRVSRKTGKVIGTRIVRELDEEETEKFFQRETERIWNTESFQEMLAGQRREWKEKQRRGEE